MMKSIKGPKGQGISINMLVVIALAVFAVFLVIGFMTGGFSYFAGAFGEITKGTAGEESARIKCQQFCASYISAGSPEFTAGDSSYWDERLCAPRYDIDLNNNGIVDPSGDKDPDDEYSCRAGIGSLLSMSECPVSC